MTYDRYGRTTQHTNAGPLTHRISNGTPQPDGALKNVVRKIRELPEESDQFRFLHADCFVNLQGSVGLILDKASVMKVTIPLDLSTWSFITLPHFFHSRLAPTLLTPFPSLISSRFLLSVTWMSFHFIRSTGFIVHRSSRGFFYFEQ